ncbi:MAG: YraN family protein [Candidatus Aureabacteria bacterium]|nr:YraN family protein [Candidatus Auribacterota bacterium]
MTRDNKELAAFGEQFAKDYLKKSGMKFLEQNYRCTLGEIDLIFRDKDALVFVEVKLRQNRYFGPAALAVSLSKQKKIIKTAQVYLREKQLRDLFIRFDVVGVEMEKEQWICKHYRNAFLAEE